MKFPTELRQPDILILGNFVMDELATGGSEEVPTVGWRGATGFEQARRFVAWHYQYAVVHDFLRRFLTDAAFKNVEKKCGQPPIQKPPPFRFPVEFSAAA